MLAVMNTAAVAGVDGLPVQVEVDLAQGLPGFFTVGLAEGAVREAKERVRAAIKNSGYKFPPMRITVNLAPAAVRKEGAGYDLPIALGILAASGLIEVSSFAKTAMVGELSLNGELKAVPGVLSMAQAMSNEGIEQFLVPAGNGEEAAVVRGLKVIAIDRLDQAVEYLAGRRGLEAVQVDIGRLFQNQGESLLDFSEVRGQEHIKRALEVAVAGGHNVLLSGVPGTGKTMMIRRLPTILPDLSLDEALETTRVYSAAGRLPGNTPLMVNRPFRAPHHTISDAGLIGGGQVPRPGEVSLAHNGVLFLDEFPEFRKHVLEVMRQPLEDGFVTISRAAASLKFPARFMLAAAMNPCVCGFFGDPVRECSCSPAQLQKYRNRLSGPLLDRIDFHLEVPPVRLDDIEKAAAGEDSASIRKRVNAARLIQKNRFLRVASVHCNAQMGTKLIKEFSPLDKAGTGLLRQAVEKLGLSARAYTRIVKIARTVADLDGVETVLSAHVAEAVQYRRMSVTTGVGKNIP